MNKILYTLSSIFLGLLLTTQLSAQGPTCESATGVCNPNLSYPAGVNTGSAQPGINYGCLISQPNPAWYVLTIGATGNGNLNIAETNSAGVDVDFALWGPFTGSTGFSPFFCSNLVSSGQAPSDCSFSSSATEQIDITGAVAGQTYLLLVTNYSNSNTQISLNQNGGTATLGTPITINPAGPYTTTSSAVTLTSNPSAGSPNVTNVSWSGSGITNSATGVFNPALANVGSNTITLSATIYGCASTATTTIVVNNAVCNISSITAGAQSACNPASNTYTQDVIVTYVNAPATGNLVVNGQNFPIASPQNSNSTTQTVTLTNLSANGLPVNATASFSANGACTLSQNSLFTAPAACTPCNISNMTAGNQTPCDPATGTYTQQVTVTYVNAPAGNLVVNGQSFAVQFPNNLSSQSQTVTLTGLVANSAPVNVTASFSALSGCSLTTPSLFTAPAPCQCAITAVTAGTQTPCDPATNTYTQSLVVTYNIAPSSGTLLVNGQNFPITGSPQTVTLTALTPNSLPVDVTASFSANNLCSFAQSAVFTAPASCVCNINSIAIGAQSACSSPSQTYTQALTISYTNPPASGNLQVNGQTFPITGSPQALTLTNLPADSNPVDVTVSFTANNACSYQQNSAFTAPAPCGCIINSVSAGPQGACIPQTNTYSQTLSINYSNAPLTGSLMINGQMFAVSGTASGTQTVTLTGLPSNGSPVSVSVSYTDAPTCTYQASNLFTAPADCTCNSFSGHH